MVHSHRQKVRRIGSPGFFDSIFYPLDQTASLKGGPYSEGLYRVKKGERCFGLVTVTDEGGPIAIRFSGRNNRDEEKISLEFSVAVASQ